jgi:ketosteroid isomerase-like protein
MDAWEVAARECIRDLVARYNASGDSGRFDELLELFADDAILEVPGATHRGHAEIRSMLEGAASKTGDSVAFVRHFTATHQIDVDAGSQSEARGRCYYAVLTDRGLDHWGRYVDEYRRGPDEKWRFSKRVTTLDAAVPGGWAASGSAVRSS